MDEFKADANKLVGTIDFIQLDNNGGIKVIANITGATVGKHGFHVHDKSDLSKKCNNTGPHFNPFNKEHGAPTDAERHVGDLGNIEVTDASKPTIFEITDKLISFSGDANIMGKGFVIHQGEDDLGKGGHADSKTTGHAGARWACGVIESTSSSNGQWFSFGSLFFAILAYTVFNR
uniref:Superoxide dismutase [Cu-Zn] n=1 Tax=Panagrolaimus sp. ES5 TaxID=591445 RepID=A0AC34F7Q2_9BILA